MARNRRAPEKRPAQSRRLGLRLRASPKRRPAPSSAVSQRIAPMPSKRRKVGRLMPFWPATGAARVARPGTNFAKRSIRLRRREKESWVRRTQMVGSMESLQRMRRTWWP